MQDTAMIQSRLAELGFDPGPIDGLMGPRTEAAIIAFKRSVGLRARAYVGPITREALLTDPPDTGMVPWMSEGARMKGLHEARDTGALMRWFDKASSSIDPRQVPWCGAFVATCLRKWSPAIQVPNNPLLARAWGDFGLKCRPQLGAVLVFSRPGASWSGHVGFYWGEDDHAYHVLGGNQSNAVTVTRIAKSRLIAARWPLDILQKNIVVKLTPSGAISRNEA